MYLLPKRLGDFLTTHTWWRKFSALQNDNFRFQFKVISESRAVYTAGAGTTRNVLRCQLAVAHVEAPRSHRRENSRVQPLRSGQTPRVLYTLIHSSRARSLSFFFLSLNHVVIMRWVWPSDRGPTTGCWLRRQFSGTSRVDPIWAPGTWTWTAPTGPRRCPWKTSWSCTASR